MLNIRGRCVVAAVAVLVFAGVGVRLGGASGADTVRGSPPACVLLAPQAQPASIRSTSISTVAQAYRCLLTHYGGSSPLRPALLLRSAMGGVVGDLRAHHEDSVAAALPALAGDSRSDWRVFARAFDAVVKSIPRGPQRVPRLVVAAIDSMVAGLHDDHTQYTPAGQLPLGAQQPDLGVYARTVPAPTGGGTAMVIDDLNPAGPAAAAGLRAGDVVTRVDGRAVPLPSVPEPDSPALDVAARLWTAAQLGWIRPHSRVVTLSVWRPSDRREFSVTVRPALSAYDIAARRLPGGAAYVRIHGFLAASTGQDAIAALRALHTSHGVIIDLRGNTGGNPQALAELLGGFVHNRVLAINIARNRRRQRLVSDDSIALLHQPLVVLVDGGSLSAAEVAAADVRDLRLGRVVGERTAGVVAGAGLPFVLDDSSVLTIDTAAAFGPDGEIIDDIGVPVDREAPLPTPAQLSDGQDPGITAAVRELAIQRARRR
jgi:carboxyl-terminal processing protease